MEFVSARLFGPKNIFKKGINSYDLAYSYKMYARDFILTVSVFGSYKWRQKLSNIFKGFNLYLLSNELSVMNVIHDAVRLLLTASLIGSLHVCRKLESKTICYCNCCFSKAQSTKHQQRWNDKEYSSNKKNML